MTTLSLCRARCSLLGAARVSRELSQQQQQQQQQASGDVHLRSAEKPLSRSLCVATTVLRVLLVLALKSLSLSAMLLGTFRPRSCACAKSSTTTTTTSRTNFKQMTATRGSNKSQSPNSLRRRRSKTPPRPAKSSNAMSSSTSDKVSSSTIALVVVFYWVVSITLVFCNKALLAEFDFPFPLSVTLFQLCSTWACLQLCVVCGWLPAMPLERSVAWRVLPLSATFVAMVTLSNLCLQYVEVSFYQVARSLTILFSIVLSYAVLGVRTSARAAAACGIVVVGFAIGARGELQLSVTGLLFGVASSAAVALYSILVKQKLALLGHNHWRLLAYNSALAVPIMLPLAAVSEWSVAVHAGALREPRFWSAMTVSAVLGFLISVATFMQINYTSPLTNNISGTMKAALQTMIAVLYFNNELTPLNVVGLFMVLGGSAAYSQVKFLEMQEAKSENANK